MKLLVTAFIGSLMLAGCNGCADKRLGPSTHDYDYVFKMFNEDLVKLHKMPLDFLMTDVQLAETDFSIQAQCRNPGVRASGYVLLVINKDRFSIFPEYSQIATLYHEIGHCFYNLQHIKKQGKYLMTGNGINGTFVPNDIMIEENRLKYLKEMLD